MKEWFRFDQNSLCMYMYESLNYIKKKHFTSENFLLYSHTLVD